MPNPSNVPTVPVGSFRRTQLLLLTLLLAGVSWPSYAQAPPLATGPAPVASLRPALANVQATIAGLNVGRWKVPGDARTRAQQDAVSIQRDLATTLPGLMTQAESPAGSALSPAFAVFRNLDALYDVLLRVAQTAALAGAGADASNLEDARAGLEDGRAKLGAWLLDAIGAQDAQIARAATTVSRPAVPPPSASRIVVEDGPENPKPRKKKSPPVTAPQ